MCPPLLDLQRVTIQTGQTPLLQEIDLQVRAGEIHALIGPNGAGKSSLLYGIAGHPRYTCTRGHMYYQGEDLAQLTIEERAQKGIFLAFQQPPPLAGVRVAAFLQAICEAQRKRANLAPLKPLAMLQQIKQAMSSLGLPESFLRRNMHETFSGGEKKQLELLQLYLTSPTLALLDETDAGLDSDALKRMCTTIQTWHNPTRSVVLVTHYTRVLSFIQPDRVHLIHEGRIKRSGGAPLALQLLQEGYKAALSSTPS